MLTGDKDILIGGSNELHRLLGEESHVLINGIVGNIRIGAIVQGDEDIQ